ncbi:MAG: formylglycine-generating enzyme family protein [Agriterribacter sp.]
MKFFQNMHLLLLALLLLQCNAKRNNDATGKPTPEGMVLIPGGTFAMGGIDDETVQSKENEYPVQVDSFYMDITEVTNDEFARFVTATGYVTIAERPIDWEEIKKQLPPGTPKPNKAMLRPGSLIFDPAKEIANLHDISQWWTWQTGASWRYPHGTGSSIEGKGNHPVVHVSFEDAAAYAKWAGKRLPTEAEWEYAGRGGKPNQAYAWGDQLTPGGKYLANFFQGTFPAGNSMLDGFSTTAPVKTYPANAYGLYDMIGNVWEWTNDWYSHDTHLQNKRRSGTLVCYNPQGPAKSNDPREPLVPKRVVKGGSFLCSKQYCSNYRPNARVATPFDSGQEHLGFRCVKDVHSRN